MNADTITAIKKALEVADTLQNYTDIDAAEGANSDVVAASYAAVKSIEDLSSTLESLQRENEELRKGKDHIAAEKAGIAKNAHGNVDYWKSQYEAADAEVKCYREALHIISAGHACPIALANNALRPTALSSTGDTHGN